MKPVKIIMLMVALVLVGCSSDDDVKISNVYTFAAASERPAWGVDLMGSDAAPSWTPPDPAKFESSMFIMVKLQDELVPYSTDEDKMTVFIDGECRALPAVRNVDQNGNIYFVLKIRGNSTDRDVLFALSYYCAGLHQMFTLKGQETFASEVTYGYNEDFVPPLLKGSSKYPVQNSLTIKLPTENIPFVANENDCVAAFSGNVCRGTGSVGKPFTIFRTTADETLRLLYYSTQQGGIYTMMQTLKLDEGEDKEITLTF